jgi:ABC-2 type transport system ATP-binding protein
VAVACALVPETGLLLLDEPTLGLDLEMAQKVMKIIEHEKSSGRLVIITTHNMELVEGIADQVAIFQDGNAMFIPKLSELIHRYAREDRRLSTAYLNYVKGRDHEDYGVTFN